MRIVLKGNGRRIVLRQTGARGQTGPVGPQGPQGVQGPQGIPGQDGQGLPVGGTSGQVPVKQSSADFDIAWETPPEAPVTSVNGQTGVVVLDAGDVGADPSGSAAQALSDANEYTDTRLDTKVDRDGDRMTGTLFVDSPLEPTSLDIESNDSGGLNSFDSTGRITLHSHQKAQLNNDGGTNEEQAHYGEVIRIDMEHQQAKGVIAFRENYLGAPEGPRTVAWLVAHGEANDSTPQNPLWHNHFSVELPDENGMLQTSFEFPFAPYNEVEGFGIPVNQMYNRSTTQLIAANRGLVVENAAGVNKNVYFSSGTRGLSENQRWGLQADSAAEGGSNAGTNFRLNRYSDAGAYIDSPLYVRRSDGQVGIGTTSPTSQLDVNGNIRTSTMSIGNATPQGGAALYVERPVNGVGFIFRNTAASGNTAANLVSQSQTASSRAFQAGVQSDSVNRLSIEASGLIEWGAGGSSGRDTNLYRSAANTLKTDDAFVANGIDASSQKITSVAPGDNNTDAVNLGQMNAALNSRIMQGTGFPNGVVSAPVGTIYVDTAVTNGASSWIKKSGTGNTGWVVLEGDTGWRDVSALLINGWTVSGTHAMLRRSGSTVRIAFEALNASAMTNITAYQFPHGFSQTELLFSRQFLTPANTPTNVYRAIVSGSLNSLLQLPGSNTSTPALYGDISFMTSQTWPTSLPGNPV